MSFYLLADCNNFYASCERVFNPSLENSPIIILSNNDGCVVARSNESKKLGIKMGVPFFLIKDFCESNQVHVFSSNYALYGDFSRRVMSLLSNAAPECEIYSIDEAFLRYPAMTIDDRIATSIELKKMIRRATGIPISCGIGPTKTLAKLANEEAKKQSCGVFDLFDEQKVHLLLKKRAAEDIWGIGSRLSKKLKAHSIFSAFDFFISPKEKIRKLLGVNGEKIYLELHSIPCHDLEAPTSKKSIGVSRSFGQSIYSLSSLKEALATHITQGALKLRQQNSLASTLHVYLEFKLEGPKFQRLYESAFKILNHPTSDGLSLLTHTHELLERIYDKRIGYRKCGILLTDLVHENQRQQDLFSKNMVEEKPLLMKTMDAIEKKYGKSKVCFASTLIKQADWRVKSDKKSSFSTTDSNHLPIVYAK